MMTNLPAKPMHAHHNLRDALLNEWCKKHKACRAITGRADLHADVNFTVTLINLLLGCYCKINLNVTPCSV